MALVVFDYDLWIARYPEFAAVSEALADEYFAEACVYLDNTACSLVPYEPDSDPAVTTRRTFLNMITAHIAALNQPGSSAIVGRIESAGEGTVNVTSKLEGDNQGRAFWSQTKYGLSYWQASSAYRTMRYVPGPQYGLPPYLPYGTAPWR